MKIADNVKFELSGAEFNGNELRFPARCDSGVFSRLKKVLELSGAVWNRTRKAYVFPGSAEEAVEKILNAKDVVDHKKNFQFYETTPEVAELMIDLADIKRTDSCLEPSAGRGALASLMQRRADDVDVIELMPQNREFLQQAGYNLIWDDFITFAPKKEYDVIVANPPFTKLQDIEHVTKMIKIAKRRVVTLMSATAVSGSSKKHKEFKELLDSSNRYEIIPLDAGTFKTSGTMVSTIILSISL